MLYLREILHGIFDEEQEESVPSNVLHKLNQEVHENPSISSGLQEYEKTPVTFQFNGVSQTCYVESIQPEEFELESKVPVYRFSNEKGEIMQQVAFTWGYSYSLEEWMTNPDCYSVSLVREEYSWGWKKYQYGYYCKYWYNISTHTVSPGYRGNPSSLERIFIGIAVYYAFYAKHGISIDTWLEYWKFQRPSYYDRPGLMNLYHVRDLPREGLVVREFPYSDQFECRYRTNYHYESREDCYLVEGSAPTGLEFECDFTVSVSRSGPTFAFRKVPGSRFGTGYEFEMYDLDKGEHILTYDIRNRCLIDGYDRSNLLQVEDIIETGLVIYTLFIKPNDENLGCEEWILQWWQEITGTPLGERIEFINIHEGS